MPYNDELAWQIRKVLARYPAVTEMKMFGGLTFLVNGHMCCGVLKDNLVVRVSPEDYEKALAEPHARPMDFTGRPLRGFVYVGPKGYVKDEQLERWLLMASTFVSSLPSPKKGRRKER